MYPTAQWFSFCHQVLNRHLFKGLFLSCILLGIHQKSLAQTDTTQTVIIDSAGIVLEADQPIEILPDTQRTRPKEAAKRSAILPGWGQAYNKKFWKIPIIYAIAGVVGYSIYWQDQQLRFLDNAYEEAVLTGNPRGLNLTAYQRQRAFHRRSKEQLIILALAAYGLNIVDAIVDAHLAGFDLSDDITLRFRPQYEALSFSTQTVTGVGFVLQF